MLPGLDRAFRRSGRVLRETGPLRGQLFGQLSELLSTGGVNARVPIIQRAVEASQQATAQGLSRTQEELSRSGVGGLFAARTLAEQRQSGAQQASQIPAALFQQLVDQLVPFLSQTQTAALSPLGALGGATTSRSQSEGGGLLSSCLAPETPIRTVDGDVPVAALQVGDEVLTRDSDGNTIETLIEEVISLEVPVTHSFAVLVGHRISPQHPIDFDTIGNRTQERTTAGAHGITKTHDIRLAGGTGEYFIKGIGWVKSTLDSRHRTRRAA